jgi:hypothetical protein
MNNELPQIFALAMFFAIVSGVLVMALAWVVGFVVDFFYRPSSCGQCTNCHNTTATTGFCLYLRRPVDLSDRVCPWGGK